MLSCSFPVSIKVRTYLSHRIYIFSVDIKFFEGSGQNVHGVPSLRVILSSRRFIAILVVLNEGLLRC